MILYQNVKTYLEDGDSRKLGKAVEKESLSARASEMMNSDAFKKMCSMLGPNGLASASKGDGSALVSTFAKTLESLSVREAKAPDTVTPKELSGPSLL